jgi:L-iditol 2-dehydrogenase
MKAAVLTGIRRMELRDVPEPTIEKDTDVLLKLDMVGVCGSDVHYYETGKIGSQVVQYPFIVGHECAATVQAVGGSVDRVKVGDTVVVEPAVSCHQCDQCRRGRENTCSNLRFLGTPGQGNGCLCEYIVMPQESCLPTNGAISIEQAVLCEPFAIGVYAVQQSRIPKDAGVAILGSGPIGLSCLAAAQAEGAKAIYMTDKLDYRVQAARKGGATWAGNPGSDDIVAAILEQEPLGLDVVYECAGEQETLDEAVELLQPGGTLMLVGIPRFDRVSFSIDKIRRKELALINVRRQNNCTQKAIDLQAGGKVDLDFMVTHHFTLEDARQAFEMGAQYDDGVIKAMIEMPS